MKVSLRMVSNVGNLLQLHLSGTSGGVLTTYNQVMSVEEVEFGLLNATEPVYVSSLSNKSGDVPHVNDASRASMDELYQPQ